jgi:hypothetical protein
MPKDTKQERMNLIKPALAMLLLLLGAVLAVPRVQAQGTISLNNYDSDMGIYFAPGVPASTSTFVQILGGPNAGSMVALASVEIPGHPTVFSINNPQGATGSFFDVGYAIVSGAPPSNIGFFRVLVWAGAPTYAQALTTAGAYAGASALFSEPVGDNAPPPGGPNPSTLNIPAPIYLTPEPSSLVLMGLSVTGLLLFGRRRNLN